MGFLRISVNFDAIAQDSWELLGYSDIRLVGGGWGAHSTMEWATGLALVWSGPPPQPQQTPR